LEELLVLQKCRAGPVGVGNLHKSLEPLLYSELDKAVERVAVDIHRVPVQDTLGIHRAVA
jgi:hypothetical protein